MLAIHFDRRSLSMGGPNPEPLPGKTLEETRAAYRELVAAGLMMPLHSFVGGKESLYRLTDDANARRGELMHQVAVFQSPRWDENRC